MRRQQTIINAIMSVVQVVVIAGVIFILYRFLFHTIGVERLGVWSIVLATTSVGLIANLGLSASVVKFVAKYLARSEEKLVAGVIQTSAISIAVIVGLVLLISYPFADWLLSLVVPITEIKEALSVLPYALLSLWIVVIANVFQAGIDGYQRIDIRSVLLMAASLIHLILCFLLVPGHGLLGLAYSQVVQGCVVLIGSWALLKRQLPLLPIIPYQWNQKLFKEMIVYGLNFQVISISQMLYDPITKALLTKFGGLAMTGFYEMASRMIVQFRALLVNANQVLVPVIADLQEKNGAMVEAVYKDSYRLLLYIALPFFSAFIAFVPIVSKFWIGHHENSFVLFSTLLAIGWCLNTLSAPAYFANLGIGELRWNTVGHVTIAALNLGLGLLLGSIYGGAAVVIAWVVSLTTGSLIIPIAHHIRHGISLSELLPKGTVNMLIGSIIFIFLSLLLYEYLGYESNPFTILAILMLGFLMIVGFPIWFHPMRRRVIGWIAAGLSCKRQISVSK